ncbi:MAG TPA: nucleotide disphospho-sugar-binding domain-containing protein [Amycolatopsis sp.]|uniref:glycosyltransferase n=1 Tax=Amycolatopsis sp. TaxID=37632 RepID=UPI002B46C3FE|nr:nucleotide disphospho-sugar-binding domain-containing protein [Amycolatopsis sp.]HKS47650.1 nucleotide disphospho-sugar-binding domain-containing protein [Amycolatopsis sp.]
MRALLTCRPALPQLYAVAPLAWAFRADGWQVLVATRDDFAPEVNRMGLPTLATNENGLAALVGDWRPDLVIAQAPTPMPCRVPLIEYRWDPAATPAGTEADLVIDACPPLLRAEDNCPVLPVRHIALGLATSLETRLLDQPLVYVGGELPVGALEKLGAEFVYDREQRYRIPPDTDVVVHDGDSLLAVNALALGVPQCVLPRTTTAARLTERLSACGVAVSLQRDVADAERVAERVSTLLTFRDCRRRAVELAREIAARPAPTEVVRMVARRFSVRVPGPARDSGDEA